MPAGAGEMVVGRSEETVRVLTVNAGSSSLKLALLSEGDEVIAQRSLPAPGEAVDGELLAEALEGPLGEAELVGHRIVHGGGRFRDAVRIDRAVEVELRKLADLAPLHQPKSLAALDAVSGALPDVPAVACFDTSFHATLPPAARTYALPRSWRGKGLRRYGFHGLSHAWVARRAAEIVGRKQERLRIVSAHLGAGASLCAIADGRSVDTTMGFTPLEGLVMATRSGSVDPGLVLWMAEHGQLTARELAGALEHEAGLVGMAGTADMEEVLRRAGEGDREAALAREVYVHRLRGGIAAMAAALGGIDVLAFTGGVGEHAPEIRSRAVAGLGFIGVSVDEGLNAATRSDGKIGAGEADSARTVVVTAREDIEIARQARARMAAP